MIILTMAGYNLVTWFTLRSQRCDVASVSHCRNSIPNGNDVYEELQPHCREKRLLLRCTVSLASYCNVEVEAAVVDLTENHFSPGV